MNPQPIELLVLDIDGVLTDGTVTLTAEGESSQTIHTQDGCAIKSWMTIDRQVGILSGRQNEHVTNRARQLGISCIHTGVQDKRAQFLDILDRMGCESEQVAYMGDDIPDLGPMELCGFPVAVANALPAVKRAAAYVTRRPGGSGAVAEVIELLLRRSGQWTTAVAESA